MKVVSSAPGKVLITGGYLILERPNAGLVLSTNARFYAIVKPFHEDVELESSSQSWIDVKLTSPQLSRETMYKCALKDWTLQCVSSSDSRNPFVEQAVQFAVAAAHVKLAKDKNDTLEKLLLRGLDITILGANDFYSYRNQLEARGLSLKPESLATLPPFTSISFNANDANGSDCKPEVAKTGLGSSAAMTTAVVAALLHYLDVVHLSTSSRGHHIESNSNEDLDLVHMVAQTAHCIAQGKVGSGFDVSSAVYGSQRYVRFSPEVLFNAQVAENGRPIQEAIACVLNSHWDHERARFSLPPLMTLLLGEPGSGGSSTPSMVGAIKKWQKSEPAKSLILWRNLSKSNSMLENWLNRLSKLAADQWEVYKNVIDSCSVLKPQKWLDQATGLNECKIVEALLGARDSMLKIRSYMRGMGEVTGVPIEPAQQTQLLDATMDMDGVLLAGVPGAGGFDAIFAVTLGNSSSKVTEAWSSSNVLAMLVREDPHGVSLESDDPRLTETTPPISSAQI